MKKLLVFASLMTAFGQPAADPPAQPYGAHDFRPGALWLDDKGVHINAHSAGMLFHDGTYYWFGEHKTEGRGGNRANVGVHVYSSKDLYNWKDQGIALKVSDDPESEIASGCVIERPKVIYNQATKKFVMWFHLELKGMGYKAARAAVAVAGNATGPYKFLGSLRPNAGVWPENTQAEFRKPAIEQELALSVKDMTKKDLIFRRDFAGGQMSRDMTLFVDEDGTAYHIYSAEENGTLHISRLTGDYLRPAGKFVRVLPGKFNEAPAMFKHRGKYFLITSGTTGWTPNAARLATADAIFGPWKELGNPCVGTDEEKSKTFYSQSTFVLPVQGKSGAFIFIADRWRPDNAIDGRYVWLPVRFDAAGNPFLEWKDRWDLSEFDR